MLHLTFQMPIAILSPGAVIVGVVRIALVVHMYETSLTL